MPVPADYAHPDRGKISLALIRRRDLDTARRIGTLIIDPGGPSSGVEFLPAVVDSIDNFIADRFDLLSWDPRGVGASSPIRCWSDREKDEFFSLLAPPLGDTRAAALLDATTQKMAAECGRRYGSRLSLFGTANSARDLDRIRAAVGDARLTYLGLSWGTRLGAAYADFFPDRVRALVLDGATDPDVSDHSAGQVRAAALEHAFAHFAEHCAADPRCPAGPDLTQLFDRLLAGATAAPLRNGDGRRLTPGWIMEAVFAGVNAPALGPQLAQGLTDADRHRDPSKLFGLADGVWGRGPAGHWTNSLDAVMTNSCADVPRPPGWRPGGEPFDLAAFERDAARVSAVAPHFGTFLRSGGGPCEHWSAHPDPIPLPHAAGAPPIVVIGTRGDPNTPLAWAEAMARQLASGVLVVNPGEGHTAYFQRQCIEQVDTYLIDLYTPTDNSTC